MLALIIAISVLVLALPAAASPVYYCNSGCGANTEAVFNATAGPLTPQTFLASDLASGGLYNANGTGINFLGFNANPPDLTVNSTSLQAVVGGEGIQIVFPGNVSVFSFHFILASGATTMCVELSLGNCNYPFGVGSSAPEFFGAIDATPLTTSLLVRAITGGGGPLRVTDFEAGTLSAAPEVRTLLLVGSGLVMFPLIRRRVRPARQAG